MQYFLQPVDPYHKQYLALRAFFVDKTSVSIIAEKFGYSIKTLYSLIRDFKLALKDSSGEDPFFKAVKPGRKELDADGSITEAIVRLRKSYLSVPDIKSVLDSQNIHVSERYITLTLQKEGFSRLPRRDSEQKKEIQTPPNEIIPAVKTCALSFKDESFTTLNAGVLCFLPYIKEFGIDTAIEGSMYPETKTINKLSSILCFLALKLSSIRRYTVDDGWCMDRGLGMFAGLNVLPKAAWFSSYSHGVTREMNLSFLKSLCDIWKQNGLLSDTMNLDFTAIPYWGDDDHLENNWSGKRSKALASILAVLAQDPDSGVICYGDTTLRHENQNEVILEFLDFYRDGKTDKSLQYLVFDSKTTTYENLKKLNEQGIRFITIRRRGEQIVKRIDSIPKSEWKNIHIMKSDGKGRTVKVYEEQVKIKQYGGTIRQIYITDNGKIKPAVMITNDFKISLESLIRKYGRRWIVEKGISEQIDFFHFNRVSSSMVIKVDFDFTMTILAHNLYRLFAQDLEGYSHCADQTLFEKFILNGGEVVIDKQITVKLKKKRNLPLLLSMMNAIKDKKISWLGNKELVIMASNTT